MPVSSKRNKLSDLIKQAGDGVVKSPSKTKAGGSLSDEQLLKMFGETDKSQKKSPDQSIQEESVQPGKDLQPPAQTVTKPLSNPGEGSILAPTEPVSTSAFLDYKKVKEEGMSVLAPKNLKPTEPNKEKPTFNISQLDRFKEQKGKINPEDEGDPFKEGQFLQAQQQKVEPEKPETERTDIGRASSYANDFNRAIANAPADVVDFLNIATWYPAEKAKEVIGGEPTELSETPLDRFTKSYRESIAEIFPANPEFQDELGSKISTAAGDLASLVLSGGTSTEAKAFGEIAKFAKASNVLTGAKTVAKALVTPPALVGATKTGVSEFNAAKDAGASDDVAFEQFLKNTVTGGVLEQLPIAKFWSRLDKTTGGGVKNLLKNGTIQGFEEATTEILQQAYSNSTAASAYDDTRKIYDGMMESGGIGFGLGFLLGGMGTSLRKKKLEAKTPEEKAKIQEAIDFVDKKVDELPKTKQEKTEPITQNEKGIKTTEEAVSQEAETPAVQEGQKLEEKLVSPELLSRDEFIRTLPTKEVNLDKLESGQDDKYTTNKPSITKGPIIVEGNRVRDGHHRVNEAKKRGDKTILAVDKDLVDAHKKHVKIALENKKNVNPENIKRYFPELENGETNPTADPGAKPEVVVPEQKVPDSEGDSAEADKSVSGSLPPNKKERQAYTKAKEDQSLSEEIKDGVKEEARVYDPETQESWDKEASDILSKGTEEARSMAIDPKSDMAEPVRVKLIKKLFTEYDRQATIAKKAGDKALEFENRSKAIELLENRSIKGTELGKTLASYNDPNDNVSPTERLYNAQKPITDRRNETLRPYQEEIGSITESLNKANEATIKEVLNHPRIAEMIKGKKPAVVTPEIKRRSVKEAVDFLESLKIDTKGKVFDVTYALPAHVYNGAISTIQAGIKAGHTVSKALKAGIAYINKNHKGEWDKDGFTGQFDAHLKKYETNLDPEKAISRTLKDQGSSINDIVKEHYTKADQTKRSIVDKLVSEAGMDESSARALAKEIETSFDKLSSKAKQDAIKKAKTVRAKGQVKPKQSVDKKLIELSNTGALSDEQVRQVYADQLGIKDITQEEADRIIDLGETIQEADIFAEEAKKDFTEKNIKKHVEFQGERQRALNQIADILESKKPKDVWDTLGTIMQGNLLSPISLATNVYSNALLQPLRHLAKIPAQLVDMAFSKATGKPRVIDLYASSMGYKTGFKKGAIEGYKQLKTGADIQELQRLEVSRGFKPVRALLTGLSGKKTQATSERVNNLIEGTFGMPAEGFFRMLNFGDKPFQRANEMAKAYELASLKGLKGEEMQKFLLFPDTESANLIKQAGEEATFKNDSEVSKVASNFLLAIQKGLGKLPVVGGPLKLIAKSQTPFVKTPLNIIMETLDFAVPALSLSKSIYYGSKEGDRAKALEYMGKAMVGVMIQAAADKLFEGGLLTGSPEDEKKESSLQYQANPPEGINISGLARAINGGDPSMKKDDTWITYNKMGVLGVIFKMRATAGQNKKEDGVKFDDKFSEVLHDTFSSMPSAASSALELSFLQGTNTLLTAIKDGKYDDWLANTFNAVTSIPLPNTLASLSRSSRQNMPELRDESLSTRFANVIKNKTFLTGDLPSKIDLWGEPIKQTPEGRNAAMYHLFDVTKAREISADPTSYQVFKLWQDTGDSDVIPSIPGKTQSYEGAEFKLTPKQYERLQMYVGKARKALVDAYLNDGENSDANEDKITNLKQIYQEGLESGKDQFFSEAIEFNDKLNLIKK